MCLCSLLLSRFRLAELLIGDVVYGNETYDEMSLMVLIGTYSPGDGVDAAVALFRGVKPSAEQRERWKCSFTLLKRVRRRHTHTHTHTGIHFQTRTHFHTLTKQAHGKMTR